MTNTLENITNLKEILKKENIDNDIFEIASRFGAIKNALTYDDELSAFLNDIEQILKKSLMNFNTSLYPEVLGQQINITISNINKVSKMRKKISSLSIGANEAIKYYTNMNSSMLEIIRTITRISTNVNEARDLNAFYNFLMSKERAGIERAVGSNTFARNNFLFGMKGKWTKLITEQDSFITSFS